jgi:hypothetical protein
MEHQRPGNKGLKKVHLPLLLTCRRAFIETQSLPATSKSHVFYFESGPPGLANRSLESYFEKFQPRTLERVKEVQIFAQQYWLEASLLSKSQHSWRDYVAGVETLRLTLRRGDWWNNEHNHPLGLNFPRGNGDVAQLAHDIRATAEGEVVQWNTNGFGSAFKYWKRLKTLVLELETYEYKEAELEKIVEWAKTWKIPLADEKMVLSAMPAVAATGQGNSEKMTWRGPKEGWANECPNCSGRSPTCEFCKEIKKLKRLGLGPKLIVFTVTFKAAPLSTFDKES